jgi:potassium channel LctB
VNRTLKLLRVRFRLSWRAHGIEPWRAVGSGYLMPLSRTCLWFATIPTTLLFGPRQEYAYVSGHKKDQWTTTRARYIDAFVVTCLALEIASYFTLKQGLLWRVAVWFCAWRAIDFIGSALRVLLFDRTMNRLGEKEIKVGSQSRNIVLLLYNYIELMFVFALLYRSNGLLYTSGVHDQYTALYFSGVTQLTIGYGEVLPRGVGRLVAVMQAMGGVVFLGFFVTSFLSGIAKISAHRGKSRPPDAERGP